MLRFPEKVTDGTFEQAWAYIAAAVCKARRRYVMEAPISWMTNLLFFCCAVLVSLGVMMEDIPVAAAYAESLPMVAQWWESYRMWLHEQQLEPRQMQLLTVGLLYGIPMAAGVLISLAVRLVYHPKQPAVPEGNRKERSWQLLETAKQAVAYTRRANHSSSVLFAALYGFGMFAFISYVLYGSAYNGVILTATDYKTGTVIGLWILGFSFAYGLLAAVLRLLTVPMYYYCFSRKALEEANRYWRMVSETEPEEETVGKQETPV